MTFAAAKVTIKISRLALAINRREPDLCEGPVSGWQVMDRTKVARCADQPASVDAFGARVISLHTRPTAR